MKSIDLPKYRALIREPGLGAREKDELITQLRDILETLVDWIMTTGPVDKSSKIRAGKPCNPLDSKPYLAHKFKTRAAAKAGDTANDKPGEKQRRKPREREDQP